MLANDHPLSVNPDAAAIPPQPIYLDVRSEAFSQHAAQDIESVRRRTGTGAAACVQAVLTGVLQRTPTEREIARGMKFLDDNIQQEKVSADEALRRFCLLAINLNEFVYLD